MINNTFFFVLTSLSESLPQAFGLSVPLGAYKSLLVSLSSRCKSCPDQVLSNFSYF